MIKKKFLLAVLFLFAIAGNNIFSQGQCGTVVSPGQVSLEGTFTITDSNPKQSLPQVDRILSISVFIVKEGATSSFNVSLLSNAINRLNNVFSPIALNFKICSVNYIDNYQLDKMYVDSVKDILTQYYEPTTINLYLHTTLYDTYGKKVKGFTYMPGDKGRHSIFMNKAYIDSMSFIHQIGHFFNLYDTHESAFGKELVNEINCDIAGDRCCDTNADPNVENKLQNGIYIGTDKDLNNQIYSPSPKNIMSFGTEDLRCFFSRTQFLRMIYALNNFRKDIR